MTYRALYIVWAELTALQSKGVTQHFAERSEAGFFDHVYTAHFPTRQERRVELAPNHTLLELRGYGRLGSLSVGLLGLRAIARLVRLVRDKRVDLIRAQDPFHQGILAWVVAELSGVPWCVSVHADHDLNWRLTGRRGLRYVVARLVRALVLRRAPLVLPIHQYAAARCQALGAPAGRIRVIYHGIDLAPYEEPDRYRDWYAQRYGACEIVSFVGRLSRENYVFDVLEIARRVADRRIDVLFLLAGGGVEEAALRARVRALDLENQVTLLGFREQQEVAALRCASAVNLCLMGGLSLIEAAASGRPTVCYDVEWHRELIEDGCSGFLVPEHDVGAAAERVLALLDDQTLAARLGQRARARAFADFSLASASRRRVAVYRELLAGRRPAHDRLHTPNNR